MQLAIALTNVEVDQEHTTLVGHNESKRIPNLKFCKNRKTKNLCY